MSNRISDSPITETQRNQKSLLVCDSPDQVSSAVLGQGKRLVKKLEHLVTAHPGAALGVAVATGVILGWWVKRK